MGRSTDDTLRWASDLPAQPPPRRIPKRLLVGLGLFVLLPALAIGVGAVWYGNPFNRAPVEAANRFLAAIDARDYNEAASMAAPCFNNSGWSIPAHILRESFPGDIEYDVSLTEIVPFTWENQPPEATVEGTVEVAGERSQRIALTVQKLEDEWKVCDYSLGGT